MNNGALLSPAAARAIAEGTKERALARLAMRGLWHLVFDPCPGLLERARPREWELLEPFLEHAAERRWSMTWSLHGHLLAWLGERKEEVGLVLARELLAACAGRWAATDQTTARGVLLRSERLPEQAVAGWKGRSPSDRFRVVLVDLEDAAPARSELEFARLADEGYPAAPAWAPLPD